MKSSFASRSSRRGFTLVELLVVVAIIVVLAAMGFGVGASAIKRAKNLTDKAAATALGQAIEGYFDEYSTLPEVAGASGGDTDAEVISDSGLMNILMAFGTEGEEFNAKEIRYYSGRTAKSEDKDKAYGGLFYTGNSSVDLFTAWRPTSGFSNDARYYQVIMDTNYDDEISDPFRNGRSVFNRRALIWSMGADGEQTSGKETDEKNRDNVYNWKN